MVVFFRGAQNKKWNECVRVELYLSTKGESR